MTSLLSKLAITKIQSAFIIIILIITAIVAIGLAGNTRDRLPIKNPAPSPSQAPNSTPLPQKSEEIIIGIEYVISGLGEAFHELDIPLAKPLPDNFSWDKMQRSADSSIDFNVTDKYVREYQDNGFSELILGLKTSGNLLVSQWMIAEEYPKTQAVDQKYYVHYSNWVRSIVERYDKDGNSDMPGLKYPVRFYEMGVEFSSYQPEPTEAYLKTLELGYKAAHEAYSEAIVGHSAFLVTPVFKNDPSPAEYEEAFAENLVGTEGKELKDIRMVLDRPDLFDVLNVHNLGWPYEIEQIVKWLNYETSLRGYTKPIIISDTAPTSFAGMGSATRTQGNSLAVMFPPATGADRSRLADYFNKLINNDAASISWLRNFLAADVVQRVTIAAEQNIQLIDTAFTFDLPGANLAFFQAAAGNSGWGGMVDFQNGRVTGKRPAYYSLQQLQDNIRGYDLIVRVNTGDPDVRMYKVIKQDTEFFIVWYGYTKLYLPGAEAPQKIVQINVEASEVIVETMKTSLNVNRYSKTANNNFLSISITPEPIYIFKND